MFKLFCTGALSIVLMLASLYGTAVDSNAVSLNSSTNPEEQQGNNPFIINELGDKVELVADFDIQNTDQNNLIADQLKKMKYDFSQAQKINPHVKGWLYQEDYVYQPFVDTPDNFQEYLHKNLSGQYDYAGTPFLSATSRSTLDGNTLIYGHNMINGTAFGKLDHLDNADNFKNAKALYVYDGVNDKFHVYKPFTILRVEDGVEFINLKNFNDEAERQNYNKYLMTRSSQKLEDGWDIDFSKRTMFFQHCVDSYSNWRRVIGFYEFNEIDGKTINISNFNGGA